MSRKLNITAQEAQDLLEGTPGIVMLYKHYDALPFEFPETYTWIKDGDHVELALECDGQPHVIHRLKDNSTNVKIKRKMTKGEKYGIILMLIVFGVMFINALIF